MIRTSVCLKESQKAHLQHISEAKGVSVAQLIREAVDRFLAEKSDIPVLGVMNAAELEDYLEVRNPTIKKQIKEGYEEYKAGKTRTSAEFFAELRAELKEKCIRQK